MAGNYQADIIFVIDASRSMEPCIEGVKRHISSFTEVFRNDANNMWNLRFDFIAHDDTTMEAREAGVDKDFRDRVISAGGMYDDVDIRFSLIWNNRNDLDLHVITPAGEEIFFANKSSSCKGKLDVDRNVQGETRQPVENIRWARDKAPQGNYKVFVRNYRFHESDEPATNFRLEAVVGGEVKHFNETLSPRGETGHASDIYIGEFYFSHKNQQRKTGSGKFRACSIFESDLLKGLYNKQGHFFTDDINTFQHALAKAKTGDNEAPLIALDCALDFPWRDASSCRRIVIFMTDEAVEGGNRLAVTRSKLDSIIEKIHGLKVLLYIVTPASEIYEQLSSTDKCEWEIVEGGDGLASVDFSKLLDSIAKSISKSKTTQLSQNKVPKALFGQDRW